MVAKRCGEFTRSSSCSASCLERLSLSNSQTAGPTVRTSPESSGHVPEPCESVPRRSDTMTSTCMRAVFYRPHEGNEGEGEGRGLSSLVESSSGVNKARQQPTEVELTGRECEARSGEPSRGRSDRPSWCGEAFIRGDCRSREVAIYGIICVNAVAPGFVRTAMAHPDSLVPERWPALHRATPWGAWPSRPTSPARYLSSLLAKQRGEREQSWWLTVVTRRSECAESFPSPELRSR